MEEKFVTELSRNSDKKMIEKIWKKKIAEKVIQEMTKKIHNDTIGEFEEKLTFVNHKIKSYNR